jgi:hypothetical protein
MSLRRATEEQQSNEVLYSGLGRRNYTFKFIDNFFVVFIMREDDKL